MRKRSRLILALDETDEAKALAVADSVGDLVDAIKINWPIVLSTSPEIITRLSRSSEVDLRLQGGGHPEHEQAHRLRSGPARRLRGHRARFHRQRLGQGGGGCGERQGHLRGHRDEPPGGHGVHRAGSGKTGEDRGGLRSIRSHRTGDPPGKGQGHQADHRSEAVHSFSRGRRPRAVQRPRRSRWGPTM